MFLKAGLDRANQIETVQQFGLLANSLWRKRHKTFELADAILASCPEPKSHRNKPSTPFALGTPK
jgi:hypothetical protein